MAGSCGVCSRSKDLGFTLRDVGHRSRVSGRAVIRFALGKGLLATAWRTGGKRGKVEAEAC